MDVFHLNQEGHTERIQKVIRTPFHDHLKRMLPKLTDWLVVREEIQVDGHKVILAYAPKIKAVRLIVPFEGRVDGELCDAIAEKFLENDEVLQTKLRWGVGDHHVHIDWRLTQVIGATQIDQWFTEEEQFKYRELEIWVVQFYGEDCMLVDKRHQRELSKEYGSTVECRVDVLKELLNSPVISKRTPKTGGSNDSSEDGIKPYIRILQKEDELVLQKAFKAFDGGTWATLSVVKPQHSETREAVVVTRASLNKLLKTLGEDDVVTLTETKDQVVATTGQGEQLSVDGLQIKALPFLPLDETEVLRTASVPVSVLVHCFKHCQPNVSEMPIRDFFGYVYLSIKVENGEGRVRAVGCTQHSIMHYAETYQSVEQNDAEYVYCVPKICISKLLMLLDGQTGLVELTDYRYGSMVSWGSYRLRFERPSKPLPEIGPFFKELDDVTSHTVISMKDFRHAVSVMQNIWGDKIIKNIHLSHADGVVRLVCKTKDQTESATLDIPSYGSKGDAPNFHLNVQLILKALENVNDDQFDIMGKPSDSGHLVFFQSVGERDWLLMTTQMKA